MIRDCRRIVKCLSEYGERSFARGGSSEINSQQEGTHLRKVFVCGNGWSGSGALYDALTEYDCVSEGPDAVIDRYINECTGSETMFVQGSAGFGRIWREVREKGRLSRFDLWELFRCHVLGAGGIGHTEHKGANAAANMLERFGSRYTTAFLAFFEAVAALPEDASSDDVLQILLWTTERLARVVTNPREGQSAIFNNAMFGPNIDMVEIFSNFRLAVVVRDPLDQYADRRAQDLKHWMTAARFIPFYRASRTAFQERKKGLRPEHSDGVREVEFERFVMDAAYRESIIEWMLEGCDKRRIHRKFEPERSRVNIGIYKRLLANEECDVIDRELRQWRRI
jgi:hypothetical protein